MSNRFTFPNNKKIAYISTWDDVSNIDSFIEISKISKKANLDLPLTLFIEVYKLFNYDYIQKYKKFITNTNHTIESHSVTHCNYNNNDYLGLGGGPDKAFEYITSQKIIKQIFGNKYANTFSYPHGLKPSKDSIKEIIKKTYVGARTSDYGFFKKGDNPIFLKTIPIETITNNDIQTAIDNRYIVITNGHGIKDIGGYNPIESNKLLAHFKFLKFKESDIWFTTLPEVMKYLKDTNQL